MAAWWTGSVGQRERSNEATRVPHVDLSSARPPLRPWTVPPRATTATRARPTMLAAVDNASALRKCATTALAATEPRPAAHRPVRASLAPAPVTLACATSRPTSAPSPVRTAAWWMAFVTMLENSRQLRSGVSYATQRNPQRPSSPPRASHAASLRTTASSEVSVATRARVNRNTGPKEPPAAQVATPQITRMTIHGRKATRVARGATLARASTRVQCRPATRMVNV